MIQIRESEQGVAQSFVVWLKVDKNCVPLPELLWRAFRAITICVDIHVILINKCFLREGSKFLLVLAFCVAKFAFPLSSLHCIPSPTMSAHLPMLWRIRPPWTQYVVSFISFRSFLIISSRFFNAKWLSSCGSSIRYQAFSLRDSQQGQQISFPHEKPWHLTHAHSEDRDSVCTLYSFFFH